MDLEPGEKLISPDHGTADEDEQLTDKLDRIAGGKTVSEVAPPVPRGPRGARAAALQVLFEQDLTGHPALRALASLPAYTRLSESHAAKAQKLVALVNENRNAYDTRIGSVAREFPVAQMGTVDRNILRIALAELEDGTDTPIKVIANEAVELARLFGSDSSPGFVNGVLGALLR